MASPDDLTVVVFKDNLSSRSFHVPLRWFSWLGLALGISFGCAALASALAWRYFRASRAGDPVRVQEIEATLGQLRLSNQELESRLARAQAQALALPQAPTQAPVPAPKPLSTQPSASVAAAGAFLALPAGADTGPLPEPSGLPFGVDAAKIQWKGNQLFVRFQILYRAMDGGSQQGRIVLLARGPSAVLGYPSGVFNGPDGRALIEPDRGEYFSVSRYREVTAELGPVVNRQSLASLDILIFDTSGKLLLRQAVHIAKERPRAPPGATQHIQPGVDQ